MSVHNSKLTIRITVLGAKQSGKTSLVRSYLSKTKSSSQFTKDDAAHMCDAVIEGREVTQQILDSDAKNNAVVAWAHGVIIVFAVDNKTSLQEAEQSIERAKQLTMKNATIMLVANKVDVQNRSISLADGQKLAAKHNCNYKELSALSDDKSVAHSVFYELSHEIIVKRGFLYKYPQKTPTVVRRLFQAITQTREQKRRSNTTYF